MALALALLSGVALAGCQWLIYFHAQIEATLGPIQKIFYMHLPLAIWSLGSFTVVFTGSCLWLWRRKPGIATLCAAAAEIGVLFSTLALATGIIWARKSWGVWWTWDPRLTTTLVMWFLYSAYLIFRHLNMNNNRREAICAVIGIAAFLDVPLVFFSARLFRSIHPAVFGSEGGGLEPEMQLAALASVLALGLFWLALLLVRKKQLDQERQIRVLAQSIENGD